MSSSTSSSILLDQLLYNGSQNWYSVSSIQNGLRETVSICNYSISDNVDQTNQLLVSIPSKKEQQQQSYVQDHDVSKYLNKLKQAELHRNFKDNVKYTDEFCWSYINRLFAAQQVEQLQFSETFRSKYILIREKTIYSIDLLENLQSTAEPGDVIVPILNSQIQSKDSVKEEVTAELLALIRKLFSLHPYNFLYVCTNGKAIEKICGYSGAVDWLNERTDDPSSNCNTDDDYRSYYSLFPKLAHSDMLPAYFNEKLHLEIEMEQIQALYLFNQTFIVKDWF